MSVTLFEIEQHMLVDLDLHCWSKNLIPPTKGTVCNL